MQLYNKLCALATYFQFVLPDLRVKVRRKGSASRDDDLLLSSQMVQPPSFRRDLKPRSKLDDDKVDRRIQTAISLLSKRLDPYNRRSD